MAELRPLNPPADVWITFRFKVSPGWLDEQTALTGRRPSDTHDLKLRLAEVESPDVRRRLIAAERAYSSQPFLAVLPAPEADPVIFLAQLEAWLQEAHPGGAHGNFEDGMRTWAEEHGSERLKLAIERGYKANATYARERASMEFPGFWLHTGERPLWRRRADPTLEALQLESQTAVRATAHALPEAAVRIVWLVEPPAPLERVLDAQNEAFFDGEAILVSPFLGRYHLVRPLAFPAPEGASDA